MNANPLDIKCYRVWADDGSAILTDAADESAAREQARTIFEATDCYVASVECLETIDRLSR